MKKNPKLKNKTYKMYKENFVTDNFGITLFEI